ncbi:MAG: hypothetical protein J6R94_01065 [Agathobacter sp.]|nr:hypothetical protein [Agathobacter sp.]
MKTLILGILASFITLYSLVLGRGFYNTNARYKEMEVVLSQIIKEELEEGFDHGNVPDRESKLVSAIQYRMGSDSKVEIIVHAIDYNRGILSVTVRETFTQINGKERTLEWRKTAIMDCKKTDIVTNHGHQYKELYGTNEN